MKNLEKIDELITEALREEEADLYEQLDEPGVLQMFRDLYRGKNAWLSYISLIYSFVALGMGIFCLIKFLQAEETNQLIKWGAGMFACLSIITAIKIYNWMDIHKNMLRQEMKRIELQIAVLNANLKENQKDDSTHA